MDQKVSLLVNRQVPEYVREDYPLFVSFMEAYYEFLENKQGNNKNDLLAEAQKLKNVSDVDLSIDEFEEQFFNTFASLVPVTANVDKAFLLKNILPLYKAKGSEKSFKLLFRFLYGEEINISYPRKNVLRASDGKWNVPVSVKISTDISSLYTGDGVKTKFILLDKVAAYDISVYVNGVLQTSGFTVYKDYKRIVFDTPIPNGVLLRIFYNSEIDKNLLVNRKIVGLNSGASALVESTFARILSNEPILELFLDKNTLVDTFETGERLDTSIWVDGQLIQVRLRSLSKVQEITVTNSGANYNVGDPVVVYAPGSQKTPTAIVSKVFKGNIDKINILEGGAGFKVGGKVYADGYGPPFVDIYINSVRTDSPNTVNTFLVFKDVISDIDPANTTIGAASYGLSGLTGNVNTVISTAFSNTSFVNIGEIIGVEIVSADIQFQTGPTFDVESASLVIPARGSTTVNTTITIQSFGSLGKTTIHDGGTGYQVGDVLQFTNQPATFGLGAAAEVTAVNANGSITEVTFVPYPISGTANGFTSNVTVIGTGTYFQQELLVGSKIKINGEDKTVVSIASNTSINVSSVFANNFTGKPVRLYDKYAIGGQNYKQTELPTVTVVSSTGTNANVEVVAIFGDGEVLQPFLGNNKPGGIQTISVIDGGKSLITVPAVDLTGFGDGTATAEANLVSSFEKYNGRWTNSDGIISSEDMKLQGLDYYIDQSYVIQSTIEFKRYKQILKELLHPAGSIVYAEVYRQDGVPLPAANVVSEITIESI